METIEKKLELLAEIARKFNQNSIVWAVGASVLLYFKGRINHFNDLDILVREEDAVKAMELLKPMGVLHERDSDPNFKTKYFFEFTIEGVDVDLIGGYRIVSDGIEYDCDLKKEEISEYRIVNDEKVWLHSLSLWKRYYRLMRREERVKLLRDIED